MSRASSLRSLQNGQRLVPCAHSAEIWLDTDLKDTLCILKGAVRIDCVSATGDRHLVTVLLEDEVIGPWLRPEDGDCYVMTALTTTLLEWKPLDAEPAEMFAESLSSMARRAARLSSLVRGTAADRVMGLLNLLAGDRQDAAPIELPTRRNIAEITALTVETVSRTITRFRKDGVLQPRRSRSSRVNGAFTLHRAELADQLPSDLGIAA